ncbi:hypothetical protein F5B21DRAFT_384375 [Xylaria acuta]|nr:hypothetical protein F5B21DRAFT_384375 [Xylaria acuta]
MMLYGRIQLWYELFGDVNKVERHRKRKEDKRVIVPLADDRRISKKKKRDPPTVKPDPDPKKRIAFVNDLLRNVNWTFMPSSKASRGNTMVMKANTRFYQVVCRLSVSTLKLVCGGTISVAERCIIYTRLAMTALHELMHAIYNNRLDTQNNVSAEMIKELNDRTLKSRDRGREPFVNYEPIAELGRSFEGSVFGGTPLDRPSLDIRTSRKITANSFLVKFPSRFGLSGPSTLVDDRGVPSMKREAPLTSYFLPAALLWRLQSKAFWDAPVDGKKGFLFPQLFTGVARLVGRSKRNDFRDIVVNPDAAGDLKFSDTISRWNEQVQLWAARRPWYREAYATWKKTAWGFTPERKAIELYIEGFKLRDEVTCSFIAWGLQGLLPDVNVTALPGDDETALPKYDTREGGPQLWLIHCLGYTSSIH